MHKNMVLFSFQQEKFHSSLFQTDVDDWESVKAKEIRSLLFDVRETKNYTSKSRFPAFLLSGNIYGGFTLELRTKFFLWTV